MGGFVRVKPYVEMTDDELVAKSEELRDFLDPNSAKCNELQELLEIERELTLREDQ